MIKWSSQVSFPPIAVPAKRHPAKRRSRYSSFPPIVILTKRRSRYSVVPLSVVPPSVVAANFRDLQVEFSKHKAK